MHYFLHLLERYTKCTSKCKNIYWIALTELSIQFYDFITASFSGYINNILNFKFLGYKSLE